VLGARADAIQRPMPIEQEPPDYSASGIVVLDGLEAIRVRPEMYLPGPPPEALVAAIVGGMCLSLEAVALGRATGVVLTVGTGLAFTVADDGRFPELMQPLSNTGEMLGEALLSVLMACRELKPSEIAHLCEVPVVVPNALSRRTTLSVAAEGAWWTLEFRDGRLVTPFTRGEPATAGGVRLSFDLDPAFFPGVSLDEAVVGAVVAKARGLVPCVRLVVETG
jgi:DNA gyrase subunit B